MAFAGAVPRNVIELDNREQGATHLEVAVHAFNRDAGRFYERFGFFPSLDRLALVV